MVEAMAFSDNSNLTRGHVPTMPFTDGRLLFVVGSRTAGSSFTIDTGPTTTYTVKPITETQNLLFRLDANTGAPFTEDNITNADTHPPRSDDITHTAFQPYTTGTGSSVLAGSGTEIIPRGALDTGVFLVSPAGSAIPDGTTFSILTTVATSAGSVEQQKIFEMDLDGNVAAGHIAVLYNVTDTATEVAGKIESKIDSTNVFRPYGHPTFSPAVDATSSRATVKIAGSTFIKVDSAVPDNGRHPRIPTPLIRQPQTLPGLDFLPSSVGDTASPLCTPSGKWRNLSRDGEVELVFLLPR